MAQLTVRKLDPELIRALKIRAAQRGRSTEAEVREILKSALQSGPGGATFVQHLLAMPVEDGDGEPFPRVDGLPRDVEL